ncbi:hypothetical protein TSAR_001569 [Trichomalopsis sarcophagae]|uniref:Uncharacterized protein n=1 Tax=Trichomalopsis sarcophagae TaxID=543379 RepID=A0A232EK14_9HYME|nr:hypothetical protein TSAR_001569 [Trichomalopsis sarcophagae]
MLTRRYIRVLRPRKPPSKKSRQNILLIFRGTLGDDVDTGFPGHQVPKGALPSRYSCSATLKTPE